MIESETPNGRLSPPGPPDTAAAIERTRARIKDDEARLKTAIDLRARQVFTSVLQNAVYEDLLGRRDGAGDMVCIGPGGRFHKVWTTVDKLFNGRSWSNVRHNMPQTQPDIIWDALDLDRVPIQDNSVSHIYCAHVIEHLTHEAAHHMLREIKRVLMPGGVLRLTCPDARLFFEAYDRGDAAFFLEHEVALTKRLRVAHLSAMNDSELMEFCAWTLLRTMSLITHDANGVSVPYGECAAYIEARGSAEAAVDAACKASDPELNRDLGWHITCWDWPRLERALQSAGLKDVTRSAYLQSRHAEFRNPLYFDRTDPHQTLYSEAIG